MPGAAGLVPCSVPHAGVSQRRAQGSANRKCDAVLDCRGPTTGVVAPGAVRVKVVASHVGTAGALAASHVGTAGALAASHVGTAGALAASHVGTAGALAASHGTPGRGE